MLPGYYRGFMLPMQMWMETAYAGYAACSVVINAIRMSSCLSVSVAQNLI